MYVDANIFCFAVGPDAKGRNACKLIEGIEHGRRAITSALAVDEVLWTLRRNKMSPALIREIVEDMYETENLEIKDVPSFIPLRALDFMEQHKLKPRDAFHLAIMEHFGITEIATDDKDFDRIPGIKRIKI